MSEEVPLARPWFGPEEAAAVTEVLNSRWVSQGPRVEEFETRLAELLGCKWAIAVNSGTSALMLALRGLHIGPGDSVVVPAFGCAATALPVLEVGARPLFADIDPVSFNVTWESISRVLAKDTRAVIVVHMFGQIADVQPIASECKRRNLLLVEDTALALGARQGDRFAGTFGIAGCFSFHPRKILTTGEGGALCTNDQELALRARAARNYGAAQGAWTRHQMGDGSPRGFSELAFNCKLTDLQAAIGLVQLNRLPLFLARRREIASRYADRLGKLARLTIPTIPPIASEHVFQAYVCCWTPEPLSELIEQPSRVSQAQSSLERLKQTLKQGHVAVSDASQFLPELPVFAQNQARFACPNSWAASHLAFAVPIFPSMNDAQVQHVADSLYQASDLCQKASA